MVAPNQRDITLTVQANASGTTDADDVCAALGISARTLYRLAGRVEFVPVKRGRRCTRWRAADVAGLGAQ